MSSVSRAVKRCRIDGDNGGGDDEPLNNLLAFYQSDVGDKILSFASGKDLCALDLSSKQLQRLTNEPWKNITKDRDLFS